MKRLFLALMVVFSLCTISHAESTFHNELRANHSWAAGVKDVFNDLRLQIDYVGGDNPIYIGYAAKGTATSDSAWIIYKYTYSSDQVTARATAFGIWDDRASLTYD